MWVDFACPPGGGVRANLGFFTKASLSRLFSSFLLFSVLLSGVFCSLGVVPDLGVVGGGRCMLGPRLWALSTKLRPFLFLLGEKLSLWYHGLRGVVTPKYPLALQVQPLLILCFSFFRWL